MFVYLHNERLILFLLITVFLIISSLSAASKDPYEILGVRRNSSPIEIKRAYKDLAKQWHPDRNKDADAERRFVEINRAYNLLNDPEQKSQYDRFGGFEDESDIDGRSERNPFADFHFGSFGPSQYQFHSTPNIFKKHDIGLKIYDDTLVNKSYTKPYLMFAYADWCQSCMRAERLWEYVISILEPDGYGIATINHKMEGGLIERLRIKHLPAVVALVDGRALHFRGKSIESKALFDFARQILPKTIVSQLNDINYRKFLEENWRANKVSAIVSGPRDEPNLRLVLAAMRFRAFFAFGYVSTNNTASLEFRTAYGLSSTKAIALETLMVFNERINTPVANVQADEISTSAINSALEANKFLLLPRLSSQFYFNDLCPPSKSSPRFCIILLVRAADGKKDDAHIIGYRDSLADRRRGNDRVRFVYVFEDRQTNFVESLSAADPEKQSGSVVGDRRHVVVLWRTDSTRARVQWLRHIWSGNAETVNRSADVLWAKIEAVLRASETGEAKTSPSIEVDLKQLNDEESPNMYKRLASKFVRSWETFLHHVGKEEFLPAISVLGTLLFMILVGYCLNHIVDTEKKAEYERKRRKDKGKAIEETKEFKTLMRELRAETYFGMVRMLKPGFRSIVVLVDAETKDVLVKQFARSIWPWRKNKTLLFGYVMVEKNLDWFRQLLEIALADPDLRLKQTINPRNVVGTVLSLNGFRQFFAMYHPKHAPSMVGFKGAERRRMQESRHFLGFESAESSDENNFDNELNDDDDDEVKSKTGSGVGGVDNDNAKEFLKTKILKADELLDGLPNWLERLFRGNARRYYIAEWPPIR